MRIEKNEIFVVCGENMGTEEHVYQLLSKANSLCLDESEQVTAVWVGKLSGERLANLVRYGAHKVLLCEISTKWQGEFNVIIEEMLLRFAPRLTIIPASQTGRWLAAEIAVKISAGLVADCIDIQRDCAGEYGFTRAAIGATIIARIACVNTKYRICTAKNNLFAAKIIHPQPQNIQLQRYIPAAKLPTVPYVILDKMPAAESESSGNLMGSRLVFGVGRGIGNSRNLELVKAVASKYGAEIAGSRAAVEQGYIGKKRQAGQSGVNISPIVYIAFGISGATQHMVGVKNSRTIVAVNTDSNAPISAYADYLVVDDCISVLEQMLAMHPDSK